MKYPLLPRGGQMAKHKLSLQDQIRRRQQSGFVGRQHQVVEFEDNLLLPVDDPARRFLFNVYGDAGVGKTSLAKRLRQVAVGNGCLTAYLDERVTGPVSAMSAVAADFNKAGARLEEFEKRAADYRRHRHAVESDPAAPAGVAAFLTKTAVVIGLSAARDIPVAGSLLAPLDTSAAADQAEQARKYLMRKFSDSGDAELLLTPEDELTPLFVSGLNSVAPESGVALFIDTYERSGLVLDDWLRRLYLGQYGSLPETLITIISGQMPLDPILWADYLPVIADTYLEPFTDAEARLFLRGKGIEDDNTVKVILSLSGKLPLWLATLADARPVSAMDVGDPAGSVVERYLRWEDDPTRRSLAMAAAFPRILNQDVLTVIAPDSVKPEVFGWLCRLPFVSPKGSYWEYHTVVRSAMLRLQMAQAPSQWRANHLSLAAAYQRWADDRADKTGASWADPGWTDCLREAIYHRLCADPVGSLREAVAAANEAAGHSSILLRQWGDAIADASTDTGDAALRSIGQQMQVLLRGSGDDLVGYLSGLVSSTRDAILEKSGGTQSRAVVMTDNQGTSVSKVAHGKPGPTVPSERDKAESRISILGPTGSGKSTFLAALGIALGQPGTTWDLVPEDTSSAQRLARMTAALTDGGNFPGATSDFEKYRLALSGWYPRTEKKWFRKTEVRERVRIGLQFIDPPGEALHSSAARTPARSELIENITLSDGIVFLLDPVREREQGDTFEFVYGVLIQLMQKTSFQAGATRGRLPHYAAVCVTKFDDPRVFLSGKQANMVASDPNDPFGFPRVSDDHALRFAKEIMDQAGGSGLMVINMLQQYFDPARTRFFVTSAVGFHVSPVDQKFRVEDPSNLIFDENGRHGERVRGPVHPINIAEPLVWLSENLIMACRAR